MCNGPAALHFGRLADVAQLVEHFTRNEGVPGSSPGVGSLSELLNRGVHGGRGAVGEAGAESDLGAGGEEAG